jgi:hypothetical protein
VAELAEVEVQDDLRQAPVLALLEHFDAVLDIPGDDAPVAELARLMARSRSTMSAKYAMWGGVVRRSLGKTGIT